MMSASRGAPAVAVPVMVTGPGPVGVSVRSVIAPVALAAKVASSLRIAVVRLSGNRAASMPAKTPAIWPLSTVDCGP